MTEQEHRAYIQSLPREIMWRGATLKLSCLQGGSPEYIDPDRRLSVLQVGDPDVHQSWRARFEASSGSSKLFVCGYGKDPYGAIRSADGHAVALAKLL